MIQVDKNNCCGCGGCAQICPKKCISMSEDNEGFLYPLIDSDSCIDCHLCEKVCPTINETNPSYDKLLEDKVYGAKNKDAVTCINSSSGGVFKAIADQFIEEGGAVFGARFDDSFEVTHTVATSKDDLVLMMGSKYVQSIIGSCYNEAKQLLESNKDVLFTGTPCQISGLRSFLRKEYDNLYTIEVICHGVPSPGIWRKYLNGINLSQVTEIKFREKADGNWFNQLFIIQRKNDNESSSTIISMPTGNNPFMKAYLSNICIRPICYDCHHKRGLSGADLTIGDFWGINDLSPRFFDKKGVSLVVAHSAKGEKLLDLDILECKDFTKENATILNKAYSESVTRPFLRNRFFNLVTKDSISFEYAVSKVIPNQSELTIFQKISFLPYRLMNLISRKLR